MKVLLGVTGSVAAIYTPELVDDLRRAGHEVRVVVTKSATYFFDPARVAGGVLRDEHEWPRRRYQRGDPVLHIELRPLVTCSSSLLSTPIRWRSSRLGIVDNCLACVYRAWDPGRPIVLAPGDEHAHVGASRDGPASGADPRGHAEARGGRASVTKTLACDDVGIGGHGESAGNTRCDSSILPSH